MPEIETPMGAIFILCTHKGKGCCPVSHCRRKSRGNGGKLCSTHHMRLWRARNPARAAFSTLRDHANARKIEFTLTFEQFLDICKLTGYVEFKGQRPQDLSMDRINFREGYVPGNIRVTTVSINLKKGNVEKTVKMSWGLIVWSEIQISQYIEAETARKDKYDPRKRFETPHTETDDDEDEDAWVDMAFGRSRQLTNEDPF